MQISFYPHPKLTHLIFAFSILFAALPAHAAYTIIDDDLMPTAAVEQPLPIIHNTIEFTKNSVVLTSAGRNTLDSLIPQMGGAAIRIIGRPDAMARTNGATAQLSRNRANSIRDYLTRHGISANNMITEVDNSPNPQANGSFYPSDLYITSVDNRLPIANSTPRAQPQTPSTNPSRAMRGALDPALYLAPKSRTEKKILITENLNIPFSAEKKEIGPIATNMLITTLPELRKSKEIIIQGRPGPSNAPHVAKERTNYLKAWLIKNGISEARIVSEPQAVYRSSDYPSCNESTIIYKLMITKNEVETEQPIALLAATATPLRERATPAILPDAISMTAIRRIFTISDIAKYTKSETQQLVENYFAFKQAGNTFPDEQIIIEQASKLRTPSAPANARETTQAKLSAPVPFIISTPALANKKTWALSKDLTLRDNMDNWAKIAGWNPSTWEASNYFQVTVNSTLEGNFPDILRQIADSTKLNICVYSRDKKIKVTDSNISCKN